MENHFFKVVPTMCLSIEWKIEDVNKISIDHQKEMILDLLQNDEDERIKDIVKDINREDVEIENKDNCVCYLKLKKDVNGFALSNNKEKTDEIENADALSPANETENQAEESDVVLDSEDINDEFEMELEDSFEVDEGNKEEQELIEILLRNSESILSKDKEIYKIHSYDEFKDQTLEKTYPYIHRKATGQIFICSKNGKESLYKSEFIAKFTVGVDGDDKRKVGLICSNDSIMPFLNEERKENEELNKLLDYMDVE